MFSPFRTVLPVFFYCSLLTNAQAESNILQPQFQQIDVEITTHFGDAQNFVEGDQISFLLSLDKAAYIYLFYQDAKNNLVQLIPNQQQTSNFYQPGLYMPVPDQQADFKFIVQPPFGAEMLWVFATDKIMAEFPGVDLDSGFKLIDFPVEQLVERIKSQSFSFFGNSSVQIITGAKR